MADYMPRELEKMSNHYITECFDQTVKNDLLNDHNWHYHFYLYFRNKNYEFGPKNYAKIIKNLVKIEFYDEPEWWNDHFLPGIDMFMHNVTDENVCKDLILALECVAEGNIETKSYVAKLKARVGYINTKFRLIEDAKFHNMVTSDLRFYKEKERLRLDKLHGRVFEKVDGQGEVIGAESGKAQA
jgi:hypothetical protein